MRKEKPLRAIAALCAWACFLTAPAMAQDAPPESKGGGLVTPKPLDPEAATPAPKAPEAKTLSPEGKARRKRAAPQDRDSMLAELYAHLATAPDAEHAAPIAKTIEGLWLHSGSDTIGVLMRRSFKALNEKRPELALNLLDAVVELAPDFTEGWSRRAYVYYLQNDIDRAVGDLRRALALDPNHYKALEGLARILRESGQKKSALKVYRQLLRIHPYMPGAKDAVEELSLEVEGRGI